MLASTDVYRPAAMEQLARLVETLSIDYFEADEGAKPSDIAKSALQAAKTNFADVLIIDTAGRLAVDIEMMAEISELSGLLSPAETLFVVDAMTGQDAAQVAKQFNETLDLTGVVLTKADGDARGGAPYRFVRSPETHQVHWYGRGRRCVELFHPDRIVGRILGMGDVMSLIEKLSRKLIRRKPKSSLRRSLKENPLTSRTSGIKSNR